jgi:hypothetical protein
MSARHGLPRLPVWAGILLIALPLCCAWMLDGPTELQAMQDVAADLRDVTTTAQVQP